MTNEQIKDYLKKYRIDSEEQLAKHIEELKRNTIPNNEIIFPLVDLLVNEKAVLLSFFAENKKQEIFTRTITPFFLDEVLGKCSTQCFCDGSCKKPQEKNLGGYKIPNVKVNATRHKAREEGKFHKEIVGDLEGINRPPSKYHVQKKDFDYLKQLLNKTPSSYDFKKVMDLVLVETEEDLVRIILDEKIEKDDVITNSSRGEKETMEGVKESQSIDKAPVFTYCKVNKNALEALSLRALYGHKKYIETDQDWQNFTRVPNALEEYGNAAFRHALNIGEEDEETHLIAEAWNSVAKLEVFLRNKLNKS
jgi:hypothetical protein